MKKIFLSVVICLIFILSASVVRAEKMRIVILNLKAEGVADQTAKTVSNMLRIEFINMGEFMVVERAQMDAIMKEQGIQASGCTDQECAVQMGKLMSARKILVGEVSPMGKSLIMTVRIVDVEKGVSEFAASQKAASEDVLDVAVNEIAEKLADRIRSTAKDEPRKEKKKEAARAEEPAAPGEITPAGYYLRGIVPGWGQFYSGHNIKGWVYAGVFVLTGAAAVINISQYNKAKDDYESLGSDYSDDDFDSKYKDYEDAGNRATLFTYIWIASYVANWVDILFFSRPDFGAQANLIKIDRDSYFTLNSYNRIYPYKETAFDAGVNLRW